MNCNFCGKDKKCRMIDSLTVCSECFQTLQELRSGSLEAYSRVDEMSGSEKGRNYLDRIILKLQEEGLYTETWLAEKRQQEALRKGKYRESAENGDFIPELERLSGEVKELHRKVRLIFAVSLGELLLGGLIILCMLINT